MPLHRLDEPAVDFATLVDVTCDSDGKINHFVDLHDDKETLEVPYFRAGEPYYLAIFLVGAYQEVMGSFHNLFGLPNEAQVVLDEGGRYHVTKLVNGSRITDMLAFAKYDQNQLVETFRKKSSPPAWKPEHYRCQTRPPKSPVPTTAPRPKPPTSINWNRVGLSDRSLQRVPRRLRDPYSAPLQFLRRDRRPILRRHLPMQPGDVRLPAASAATANCRAWPSPPERSSRLAPRQQRCHGLHSVPQNYIQGEASSTGGAPARIASSIARRS